MNNKQIEFVKKVYPAAERLAKAGGVSPLFVTAQAALETGWEIRGIGNNIFGITKGSWTGDVSLELTTEYFKTPTVAFPSGLCRSSKLRPIGTNIACIAFSVYTRPWTRASTITWRC